MTHRAYRLQELPWGHLFDPQRRLLKHALSRVKELVDQGVPTEEAVTRGIRTTASTVTSAAAMMVAVFAIFASLRSLDIKQLSLGLAIAVLRDATLIRGVLLPAAMKLLGDWNWYLPCWLGWLPHLTVEPELPEKAPEAVLVPAGPAASGNRRSTPAARP